MPETTPTGTSTSSLTLVDEIKNSVSATLYERISDPLIGAYVIAFLLWNWQPISILIFGGGILEMRIIWVGAVYDFPAGSAGESLC
ncbi:MAG: hypothetical protein JNM27_18650, partial [Leptospirales bacterium]|nr:hypothetical protein [Leptospirales bacterium]